MKRLLLTTAALAALLTTAAHAERLHPETVATTSTEALLFVYPDFVHACERGSGDMCEAVGMIVGELSTRGCQFSDPRNGLYYRWSC